MDTDTKRPAWLTDELRERAAKIARMAWADVPSLSVVGDDWLAVVDAICALVPGHAGGAVADEGFDEWWVGQPPSTPTYARHYARDAWVAGRRAPASSGPRVATEGMVGKAAARAVQLREQRDSGADAPIACCLNWYQEIINAALAAAPPQPAPPSSPPTPAGDELAAEVARETSWLTTDMQNGALHRLKLALARYSAATHSAASPAPDPWTRGDVERLVRAAVAAATTVDDEHGLSLFAASDALLELRSVLTPFAALAEQGSGCSPPLAPTPQPGEAPAAGAPAPSAPVLDRLAELAKRAAKELLDQNREWEITLAAFLAEFENERAAERRSTQPLADLAARAADGWGGDTRMGEFLRAFAARERGGQ